MRNLSYLKNALDSAAIVTSVIRATDEGDHYVYIWSKGTNEATCDHVFEAHASGAVYLAHPYIDLIKEMDLLNLIRSFDGLTEWGDFRDIHVVEVEDDR